MDTGADQAPPPPPPPPVAAASAAADEPRDLRVVREILHSLGLREGDYEEAAVHKLLLFAHRYAGDVLGEAKAYAGHAGRESLQADDVRLAIQARGMSSAAPPSREVIDLSPKPLFAFVEFSPVLFAAEDIEFSIVGCEIVRTAWFLGLDLAVLCPNRSLLVLGIGEFLQKRNPFAFGLVDLCYQGSSLTL